MFLGQHQPSISGILGIHQDQAYFVPHAPPDFGWHGRQSPATASRLPHHWWRAVANAQFSGTSVILRRATTVIHEDTRIGVHAGRGMS